VTGGGDPSVDAAPVRLFLIDPSGTEHALAAPSGWSLMEAAVKNDVGGIVADCGGACSCATCHVYVDPAWVDRLPAIEDMEDAMLDCAEERRSNSRLSCQIRLTAELDGLRVEVPENQM
jgi:2Fe-2S ferredoxin